MRRIANMIGLMCVLSGVSLGQVDGRACFVANNGNLEGSVTSFTFDPGGAPLFVEKLVIGQRESGDPAVPGTNAFAIDLSPDGRYLLVSHATSLTVEQLTLIRVHADATMEIAGIFQTPDSPLDLGWVRNDLVAVTKTDFGSTNEIIMYRFDEQAMSLTEVDRGQTGTFTSSMDVHPSGRWIYAGDSNTNTVYVFEVLQDGTLDRIQATATGGAYPLDVSVSHDGTKLYAAGGISGPDQWIVGFHIGPDGLLSLMDGSPFLSPGDSPKGIAFSADDSILYVDHGRDATVRSFFVDPVSGDLTPTGHSFDVGLQGSHGETITLEDLLLFTDDTTATDGLMGLYSFDVTDSGDFSQQNGPLVDTQGFGPEHLVGWSGVVGCVADLDGDGDADADDFFAYLDAFAGGEMGVCDRDGDGDCDADDFFAYLDQFAAGC